jgi:SnoaL-like protein
MYSVEELSDRVEIQDRLAMYCHAFDRADWAALDGIFLPETTFDFASVGIPELTTWAQLKVSLRDAPPIPFDQHVYTNTYIEFDDVRRTAVVLTKVFNPQCAPGPDGRLHTFAGHGEYRDEWRRTDSGWRVFTRQWTCRHNSGDYPYDRPLSHAAQRAVVAFARGE